MLLSYINGTAHNRGQTLDNVNQTHLGKLGTQTYDKCDTFDHQLGWVLVWSTSVTTSETQTLARGILITQAVSLV